MSWARLIARTFEHGHRAVCDGDLFEVEVDPEEHVLGRGVAKLMLARYSTIKEMGRPHRLDMCAWAEGREHCAVMALP